MDFQIAYVIVDKYYKLNFTSLRLKYPQTQLYLIINIKFYIFGLR